MWINIALGIVVVIILYFYVFYQTKNVVYIKPIEKQLEKAKPNCIPTTLKGYMELPEDVSAQNVSKIYYGDKESDIHLSKPIANYVFNAGYEMANGYRQNVPDYVYHSPIVCGPDKLACSEQNRQCLTDLSQINNSDDNTIYQQTIKKTVQETTAHNPGYTREKPTAFYI